jgi:hypothetical protein
MSAAQMAALKRAQESAQQYTEEQKAQEEQYTEEQKAQEEEPEFDAGDMDF